MKIGNVKSEHRIYEMLRPAILLLMFLNLNFAMAQTTSDIAKANKEIILLGFEKWTAGTGSFFDLLAEDMVWTITGSTAYSKTYNGKRDFINQVIDPLNQRLSKKIVPTVRGIYGDGDMVIALWDGVATAKDGKPYLSSYSWYMQMDKGKIIKVVAFLDGIEFADIMKRLPAAP